jgi:hypothetical protein
MLMEGVARISGRMGVFVLFYAIGMYELQKSSGTSPLENSCSIFLVFNVVFELYKTLG